LNEDYPFSDHDTQDPVTGEVTANKDEETSISPDSDHDEEAMEVLLSRPGSALTEATPEPTPVPYDHPTLDVPAEEPMQTPEPDVAPPRHDAETDPNVNRADGDNDVATGAPLSQELTNPQVDITDDKPIASNPFSADTGEHQQTPLVDPVEARTPSSVDVAAIDEDTAPSRENVVVNHQFENAHTSPLQPALSPRPAQQVPAPTPLPTSERALVATPNIPAAPLTPPPPYPANRSTSNIVQQRVQAYAYAGYRLLQQRPNEIVMGYGKPLGFFWWIVGSASIVGIIWYFFVLLISGFQRDKVYIALEPNGHLYEEGPGAAHVRHRRSQNARRWGVVGVFMVLISIFSLFLVILAASVLAGRYDAELNAAYPEFGFVDATVDTATLDSTEVQNVRVVVLTLIILVALSLSGAVIGTLMAFIGYLQAAAYRVGVSPLPYLR
jgi:hypothetical protein